MPYRCPFCSNIISFVSGHDAHGPDYGGEGKEVDYFHCGDCQRDFCQVARERFSGVTQTWEVATGTGWAYLKDDRLPQSVKGEKPRTLSGKHIAAQKVKERSRRLADLRLAFQEILSPARGGLRLADLIKYLFAAFELPYERLYPAKTGDPAGAFVFQGIRYSVMAPHRDTPPSLEDLLVFKRKIETMQADTRGCYVSAVTFDLSAIQQLLEAGPARIFFMDGHDLTVILDGRVSVAAGLETKIGKAFQERMPFYPLPS